MNVTMPSSQRSRSDSLKTQKLDSDSFVEFDHAAAGHDGVRCTLSGSLIAKPCTAEEVAFYEASALHPEFREFIPTYIGTLSSAEQQQPLALGAAQHGGAVVIPDAETQSIPNAPSHAESSQSSTAPALPSSSADKQWVPSGGKKLDTGVSIVLENVASGFKRPNVLDVKLGARLWADDAPPSKRNKLDTVSRETTSSSLGFRIAGMKVWTGVNGESEEGGLTNPYAAKHEGKEGAKGEVIEKHGYRRYDKWYGRSFNESNVKEGFATFLACAKMGTDRSKLVARRLADSLRRVQRVLESEESRMYSSSVLVVYEGDPDAFEHALEEEKKALENPPKETEDEDDDDDFEFDDSAFEVVDMNIGEGGIPQQTINLNFDPGTAQLSDLEDDDEDDPPKVHDLRLIDFAHANWTPGLGPDQNTLMGIRSLVKVFEELDGD